MTSPAAGRVLLAGATGLVGGHALSLLLDDPEVHSVIAFGRSAPTTSHRALHVEPVDFDRWLADPGVPACDTIVCCLGTTRGKARSRAGFRRVDRDFPAALARAGRDAGAARFLLVSALGADPDSRFFYNRVKGEAEEAVRQAGYPFVGIVRPSLLLGDREESRPAETAAAWIGRIARPALRGPLRRYRPVRAADVAATLVALARATGAGVRVVESEEIGSFPAGHATAPDGGRGSGSPDL